MMIRLCLQLLFTFTLFLSGCASNGDGKTERLALLKETNPKPMDIIDATDSKIGDEEAVKKAVTKNDHIYDVVIVKNGKEMLVAYKIKHMHRFRMKQVEKKLTKDLNKKFEGIHFIVSSDYKIFLEAVRLNKLLRENEIPREEAKKEFKQIVELKEEKT
ncbi:YhcN/YlaJ family sporulation lipoprotein [Peribacillus loiseleuriae]|uniref:YhcN/YlaJ family sporulation lipoprotein n=1 Tax=Peribacillus loiseleuriae TaxID=1679170 RepID=UPI0038007CCE